MPIRLVVVDDHPIVLSGLQQLFGRHEDLEVVACCGDVDSALEAIRAKRPDVIVLDLKMPRKTGIDLLDALAAEKLPGRAVVLTAAISQEAVVDVMKRGAAGLVLKESSPDELVACVRRVFAGEQWIDQETVTRALQGVLDRESARADAAKGLTPREVEIVGMVAQGLRNRAIGERLSIPEGTVKVHLHNIYEKMGVEGRLELVLVAQQKGLV